MILVDTGPWSRSQGTAEQRQDLGGRSPIADTLIPPAEDDLDGHHGLSMPVRFAPQAQRLRQTHGSASWWSGAR